MLAMASSPSSAASSWLSVVAGRQCRSRCVGFAVPALYDACERAGLTDTIGLAPNPRLREGAAPLVDAAKAQYIRTGANARLAGEAQDAADSWAHARRVVYKAEQLEKGSNLRFVVTSRTDLEPLALYNC